MIAIVRLERQDLPAVHLGAASRPGTAKQVGKTSKVLAGQGLKRALVVPENSLKSNVAGARTPPMTQSPRTISHAHDPLHSVNVHAWN
jgi:hypothetical protein